MLRAGQSHAANQHHAIDVVREGGTWVEVVPSSGEVRRQRDERRLLG